MEATLIYNASAGGVNQVPVEALQDALSEAGYYPVYRATSSEADLDLALEDVNGLVVAAGGDGTIRAVATRLLGRNIPLAFLPLGTANNIGKTLGVTAAPLEIIAGLKDPQKRRFDVGRVRGPWGEDYFLEGAGYGFYADTLALYDPDKGKSVLRGLDAVRQALADYKIYRTDMKLDGQDISGDYLLVEVLNMAAIGPRLKLAPNADPGDGLFDVVCVHQDAGDQFARFAVSFFSESLEELPTVEIVRGQKLEITWVGFPIHIDGEVRPKLDELPAGRLEARDARLALLGSLGVVITVEILPQAIEFWLPPMDQSPAEQSWTPVGETSE